MKRLLPIFLLVALGFAAPPLAAQTPDQDTGPAFNVWSSQIFLTKDRPSFSLTHRNIDHLDFRVYRVADPMAFFAGLRDPHTLGSEKPVVPQDRTWLERIALWKAARRSDVRMFVRAQLSHSYRVAQREAQDKEKVSQRQTLQYNSFAQVPLLNASRLVASWRELLRPVRDSETRRIPLDVHDPGVYLVEAVSAPLRAYTIVMVSDIGVVTKTAPGQILVYAAHRLTGEPQKGCDVQTTVDRKPISPGKTDDDGLLMTAVDAVKPESIVTVARCGSQVTATDPGGWAMHEPVREFAGYIYTDKPIYRPGHTARVKAVLRWRINGQMTPTDLKQAEVSITDGNDKVLYRETRPVDAFGTLNTSFPIPAKAGLGYYTIAVASRDQRATGHFEVQEYRKPEFEVTVSSPDRFVVQGRQASVTINAKYYFGQPVANGIVKYTVYRQPYYSPFRWGEEGDEDGGGWWGGGEETKTRTVRLDDKGMATVSIPLPLNDKGHDYSSRIEARVTDASSREVSGHTFVHATVGTFFVTAEPDRYVQRPGSQAKVLAKVLNYLGAPQAGVSLRTVLERLTYAQGRWSDPTITEVASATVQSDQEGRAEWAATLPASPGTYRFRVRGESEGHGIEDTASLWVSGDTSAATDESDSYLELIADKKSYQPGDTARLIVRGGEVTAPVLVTKEGQQISSYRVARVGKDAAIEVPVVEGDFGDTYVSIVFVSKDRLFRAEKRLKVPALPRQLQVAVAAEQNVSKPRQPGRFTLTVTDAAGQPVKAQLSVGVIDEAVYGVKPDDTPDPLRFFYRVNYSRVSTEFSRDYSFTGYSGAQQLLLTQRRARRPLTLADFKGEKARPQVRKDFPDAIFWIADLVTDAQGKASVEVPYPDALTTWRLTARAITADTKVGAGIARTMTTKDLILRIVPPRFLTEGDTLDLPVVVHNYTAGDQAVTLTGKAAGLAAGDAAGAAVDLSQPRTIQVAQNGEVRLDWRLKASMVGTATVTGSAITPADSDAVELPFPVLPFGLKREVGSAGSIVGAGEQSADITIPETANPAARSMLIQIAPSLAGPLLGALEYLTSYPYGCTEQTLSSFVPNLVARRALTDLKLPLTESLKSLDRQVSEGIERLIDYRHPDGGWGWWKTDENHPFMTAYAIYGLLEAKAAGYKVDQWTIESSMMTLRKLYATYPRAIPELKVYSTYVLLLGQAQGIGTDADSDDAKNWNRKTALDELWNARGRMTAYGQSLLLMALDLVKDARGNDLANELTAAAKRKGDLAWWPTDHDPLLEDFNDTSVEATAFAVRALARRDPKNPLLEPAVRWLLLNRTYGVYWASTKQTAMVLYGLLDVMKARGEAATDSEVDVIVNGASIGTRRFTAASITAPDPIELTAPARGGANSIRLVKRGGGAVYWAAQATYYDTAAAQERTGSRKLALQREYFSLAPVTVNGRVVYRETPFTGTARPGDLLLVRLTTAGSKDWRYLMLEDPIPAGTEPIQQEQLYALEKRTSFWWGSRREFRDSRVVFFLESFAEGRYEFSYMLKVTTPGVFRATPARISAMYVPEATASSATMSVTVESATPTATLPKGGQQ
ncbi:MAG: MG2 domain-containing protein [Acidobacteriota bacterium]